MNSANIRLPYTFPLSSHNPLFPPANPHSIFAPSATNNTDAINNQSEFISYDPKDLIDLVDCLKTSGLLDDVPLPDKLMLDDFCDDLKLPASERRFNNYAARRMSDFITRRCSMLPHQTKSNTFLRSQVENTLGQSSKSQGRLDMDETQMMTKNALSSSHIQGFPDLKTGAFSSMGGQNIESISYNTAATQNNNFYPTLNNMNMNAELYLAIHDRLNQLKQEELQLNLLLQTTLNPFQADSFIHDGNMNALGWNQGLDLESQRQLRRLSLLNAANAIGLPPQDILNLQMDRRGSFYPFLGYSDFNPAFDFSRTLQTGGMNPSSSLQDLNFGDTSHSKDHPTTYHQRDLSDDLPSSILDESDADALVSTKSDDPQEQRRGSLDLLGTVAAAASPNVSSPHVPSSKGSSMESTNQDLMGYHLNSLQQGETLSPTDTGNLNSFNKKRQIDEHDTRNDFENWQEAHKRTHLNSISDVPAMSNEELYQAMENLKQAMIKSQTSQRNIQKWDKQFGLKRSHSMTMTKTTKSRNQVRLMLDRMRTTIVPTSDLA